MKKSIVIIPILFIALLISLINFTGDGPGTANLDNKKITFEGKTDGYNSLNELENRTTVIIKGIKKEEISTEVFKSEVNDGIVGGYEVSEFQITDVFKNSGNNGKIRKNSIIPIMEHSFYDEETDTTYNVNGYQNMNSGEEYLLFLAPETEGLFAIQGVTLGKIPFNTNNTEIDNRGSFLEEENIGTIFDEAKQKYK